MALFSADIAIAMHMPQISDKSLDLVLLFDLFHTSVILAFGYTTPVSHDGCLYRS